MWFNNTLCFRVVEGMPSHDKLNDLLAGQVFSPCGPMQMQSAGFYPPRSTNPDSLVHHVQGRSLLEFRVEKKLLPAGVVRQQADKKIAQIEQEQQRKVGKKERKELIERVTDELLPKAFTKASSLWLYIDHNQNLIVINATSSNRAEEVIEYLRRCHQDLRVKPIRTESSPASVMTTWVQDGEAHVSFSVDDSCELYEPVEDGAKVKCHRQRMDSEEIHRHLEAGKIVGSLALTWNDRISFVLTENLQIKKLSYLDKVIGETSSAGAADPEEQFDANFAIMSGELGNLLPAIMEAMGGEVTQ